MSVIMQHLHHNYEQLCESLPDLTIYLHNLHHLLSRLITYSAHIVTQGKEIELFQHFLLALILQQKKRITRLEDFSADLKEKALGQQKVREYLLIQIRQLESHQMQQEKVKIQQDSQLRDIQTELEQKTI